MTVIKYSKNGHYLNAEEAALLSMKVMKYRLFGKCWRQLMQYYRRMAEILFSMASGVRLGSDLAYSIFCNDIVQCG